LEEKADITSKKSNFQLPSWGNGAPLYGCAPFTCGAAGCNNTFHCVACAAAAKLLTSFADATGTNVTIPPDALDALKDHATAEALRYANLASEMVQLKANEIMLKIRGQGRRHRRRQ